MSISIDQVKELRDLTGVSVMQCKKALEEAQGDMDKAQIALRKISKQVAEKKGDRLLGAGTVVSYVHTSETAGALIELMCETDFVAKNADFKSLARDIAMHIVAMAPLYVRDSDISPEELEKVKAIFAEGITAKTDQMREKILSGKLQAYFAEKVLLEQVFIKSDQTIKALLEAGTQKFGERIEVGRFARFQIS